MSFPPARFETVARVLARRDRVAVSWLLAVLAAIADVGSTLLGLHLGRAEGNPVVATVLATTGVGGFVVLKVLVILTVGFLGVRFLAHRTIAPLVLTGVWGVVAAINVVVLVLG